MSKDDMELLSKANRYNVDNTLEYFNEDIHNLVRACTSNTLRLVLTAHAEIFKAMGEDQSNGILVDKESKLATALLSLNQFSGEAHKYNQETDEIFKNNPDFKFSLVDKE